MNMNINIKQLFDQYWENKLSKSALYEVLDSEVDSWEDFIKEGLETGMAEKSDELLDDYLTLIFLYKVPFDHCIQLLNKMLISDWHHQHENIALLLEKACDASSIEYLYDAAIVQFKYLEFDENYALAVKCIWALGKILRKGSPLAKEKLELLAQSTNDVIKENSIKQLQMSS